MGSETHSLIPHVVNSVVTLVEGKTEKEEVVIVADHENVADFTVSVFTNIDQVFLRFDFDPHVLEHEPQRLPPGIACGDSETFLNLHLSTRSRNHNVKYGGEVVLGDKNVG